VKPTPDAEIVSVDTPGVIVTPVPAIRDNEPVSPLRLETPDPPLPPSSGRSI
jgi:hypothetical protein